ncbi:LpqB family beta-propeller domain-containing protein [Microlunatus sp. GCM10028923]|uniref:LpqB family beta-propeller domain-containing protein n=1 Tax=Microlunatus sp. GCM10028923 TaxID=3273400 RepID=UPI003623D130
MNTTSRGRIAAGLLVLLLAVLAGCAEVPTSGPVDPVEGAEPSCRGCLNVDPAAPQPGDDPKTIVDGFLQAMAAYEPTYATARKYLTKEAAERWDPDKGVTVYIGQMTATSPTSFLLDARTVGVLGPNRDFLVRDQRFQPTFRVEKQGGEWRINNPVTGLLVPKWTFDTFYDSFNVYFVGRDGTLVPDVIYLPERASIASALMLALLAGPSGSLGTVVGSALPAGTTLDVQSASVEGGVAEVQLSDAINQLTDQQRILMAAQIAETLRQYQVQSIQLRVNGEVFRIPGADPQTGAISVNDERIRAIAALPPGVSDQLYAATDDGARMITDRAGKRETTPVSGDLGKQDDSERIAVSLDDRDIAVVTENRTVLRRQGEDGRASTVIEGVTDLLRPQYSRQGELWAIGDKGGQQLIWAVQGEKVVEVQAPRLRDGRIVSFKLSPDGSRIAMVREVGSTRQLTLALVNRVDGRIVIDEPSRVDTAGNQGTTITQFRDVGWQDDSRLLVIGAAAQLAPVGVYLMSQDASQISVLGELPDDEAAELATSPTHNQVAIVTKKGEAYWLDPARRWTRISAGVDSLAYPG